MKPPNVKLELEVLGRALISFLLNYLPTFISLFIESHYKTVTTALIQEQCFSFLSLYLRDHPKIHFGIIPISRQQRDMVGGVRKMAIYADIQYYLCRCRVGGSEKV